jgi:hypothetical protein
MVRCGLLTWVAGWVLCGLLPGSAWGQVAQLTLTVSCGVHDRAAGPIAVPLVLPQDSPGAATAVLVDSSGRKFTGQITPPGLLERRTETPGQVQRTLHFIGPAMKAGDKLTLQVRLSPDTAPPEASFRWHDTPGQFAELKFGQQPVLRYMYEPLDESSPARRERTYKVFHHLYDPTGARLVTKGAGGKYTHHRGVFYGFNRVSYDGGQKKADVWHCSGDACQTHEGFVAANAGPVLGRHVVKIAWRGPGKEAFAEELRELTAYRVPGGQLIDFASRLVSKAGPVRLDGDPQHAGFHFRADNEVADATARQTYYLRPDGRGKPGETRNWAANNRDPKSINLPWNAMSFVLGDTRYTAFYLDRPGNPKEARYSERDYGRFGSYFEYDLTENRPLEVRYRVWLQAGEADVPHVQAASRNFVEPVEVVIR